MQCTTPTFTTNPDKINHMESTDNKKTESTNKIGRYGFLAEPFHCDFSKKLFMGHLGNHLLNAADFHSNDRDFGMNYLNPIHKTWVLSRLAIEMTDMPAAYEKFDVETWVESAMRYFTNRNFRISSPDDSMVYGYGRSVWAMIDTETRQPQNIMEIRDGEIMRYIDAEKECPIGPLSRVKMSKDAELLRTIDTHYSDVDVNGHINSVKYIEHVLDLFPIDWYKTHRIKRFDIAYVAESYYGDQLKFYREKVDDNTFHIRICKSNSETGETEVVRSMVRFDS